jgi:hypothetical protein
MAHHSTIVVIVRTMILQNWAPRCMYVDLPFAYHCSRNKFGRAGTGHGILLGLGLAKMKFYVTV